MNIGVDIDDTMVNTTEMLVFYAQKYDVEVLGKSGAIKNDKAYFFSNEMFDWSDTEYNAFMHQYIDYIFENAAPKSSVKEVFEKLRADGHKIIIMTARRNEIYGCRDAYESSAKLFDKNNIPYDKLVIACRDKALGCKEYEIDILIDDRVDICKLVSLEGVKSFVMDTAHNRDLDIGDMTRVYSWEEMYSYIRAHE